MAPLVVAIKLQPPLRADCPGRAQAASPVAWPARLVWTARPVWTAVVAVPALLGGTVMLLRGWPWWAPWPPVASTRATARPTTAAIATAPIINQRWRPAAPLEP